MKTAREIMTPRVEYLKTSQTIQEAAERLALTDIGAMPICRDDGRLTGMVTDRDIVVRVIAAGRDPRSVRLEELTGPEKVVTIGADDSVEELIETMKQHQVRRLPVIDGNEVIGMVSQGDVARQIPTDRVGDLLASISD
jgi:CBS domain-containing protein